MKRLLAASAAGLLLSLNGAVRAAQVETLRSSGPPDKRFNIVVLGDGYRVEDQAKLTTDATAIVDYLFEVAPLKQYAQFFNVKLVHVISKENGADNGSYGANRDTALGANFGCFNIDRLLCIDTGLAQQAAAADVKEFNFIMVLVNDSKYGGAGGNMCVTSANEASFDILSHEIGHSLAGLGDEYSDAGSLQACDPSQDCPEANVTLRTQREQIKWRDWLEQGTPLPTPASQQYAGVVGLFEGARYQPKGVYRPKLDCKMRNLGASYCPVCSEQFVKSIWTSENIQMIESATPAQEQVETDSCDAIQLGITSPPITPSTYKYAWTLDGNLLPETTSSISLAAAAVMNGSHQVKVAIEDATALVRSDPDGVMKDERTWTVSVTRSDCALGGGGGMPGGGMASAGTAGGGVGGGGTAGAGGGGAGGGAAGSGVGPAAGGVAASAGSGVVDMTPLPPPRDSSGCGCALPGRAPGRGAALFAVLGAGTLLARRRARR